MEKTINIISVKEIEKKDKSGVFYVARVVIDNQGVEALCFDSKIKGMTGDQTLEVTQKDNKWFINFPKEKKAWSGGAKTPYKSDRDPILQLNSFACSYAKDIVIALINNKMIDTSKDLKQLQDTLFILYDAIKANLAIGIPKEVKPNTEKDVPESVTDAEESADVILFRKTDEQGQRLLLKTLCATKGYTPKPETNIDTMNASDRLKFIKILLKMENKK